MKIFQVITRSDTIGGAQRHVFDISSQLIQDGHQVDIISSGHGAFRDLIENSKMKFFDLKVMKRNLSFLNDIRTIYKLRKKIIKDKPCVVAIHSVKAGLLCRLACIGLDTLVCFTAHGWSHIRVASNPKKRIYILLEYLLSKISHKVICVSLVDYNYSHNVIGISKEKLQLIRNGVLNKQCDLEVESCDILRLLSVVRFQAPKDFNTLLQALSIIKELPWSLKFVGDGSDIKLVKEQIITHKLEDKVTIEGFQDDVNPYYKNSDAVILISKSEGLPMSLIEAMSFSKLLIASNVGGIPELIKDGWNGYLIEDNDSIKLAKVIQELILDSTGMCKALGDNSFTLFSQRFSAQQMFTETYKIYGCDAK